MNGLPPVGDDRMDAQDPCGPDGVCTREVYAGWWTRGEEIYNYLKRVPERYPKELGMGGLYEDLLRRWTSEVKTPSSVDEEVNSGTLGTLLGWIRESETLIYYVTYQEQGRATPGSTTPGLLEVVEPPPASAWHWPWIEGWDDASKRDLILNPRRPKKWTMKKILVAGGVGVAAIYAGKKMFADPT
jgi:hypothetical protein